MRAHVWAAPAPPAPVTVRVVRGVWYGGRGWAPGEILVLTPREAAAMVAAGKGVVVAPPGLAPPFDPEPTPVLIQAREPVRRMRR